MVLVKVLLLHVHQAYSLILPMKDYFGDYIEDILARLMEGKQDFMSLISCNYNSNKKVNVKAA